MYSFSETETEIIYKNYLKLDKNNISRTTKLQKQKQEIKYKK